MPRIDWKHLVGQDRIKEVLGTAFANNSLGHAYLLCGDEGVGTVLAALELAMAVLCLDQNAPPCYQCESCRKVIRYAHPDFHLIFPLYLQKTHRSSGGALSEEGWRYLSESVQHKIAEPYVKTEHQGIPTIPVEWVRETNHAIVRGTLSGRTNVAILCGIDTMNKESANAMLKTLEEPPPNTLIVLCTERPHAVLPTILSRCQILRMGHLKDEQIAEALRRRADDGDVEHERLQTLVQGAQGSLGRALQMLSTPLDQAAEEARNLLLLAGEPDWLKVAQTIDQLTQTRDFALYERLLQCCIHTIRASFLAKVQESSKYISDPSSAVSSLLARIPAYDVDRLLDACETALRGVRARGYVPLVLTTFLLELREIVYEQEQQAG